MKSKTLEYCPGSHEPAHEHSVFQSPYNSGRNALHVCKYCDKLIRAYTQGDCAAQLRAHGHYLPLVALS